MIMSGDPDGRGPDPAWEAEHLYCCPRCGGQVRQPIGMHHCTLCGRAKLGRPLARPPKPRQLELPGMPGEQP